MVNGSEIKNEKGNSSRAALTLDYWPIIHLHTQGNMLNPLRRCTPRALSSSHPSYLFMYRSYATADRSSDRVATNDPSPPAHVQNVSDSNAVPIDPQGLRDGDRPLQEMPEDSETQRVMQAPNRDKPWSRSQQPRERAMSGPRFEQTIMHYQVGRIRMHGMKGELCS